MGKVLFSVCLSAHTSTGVGGGYPSQVWMVGRVPRPGLDGAGGETWPGLDGGGGTPARS